MKTILNEQEIDTHNLQRGFADCFQCHCLIEGERKRKRERESERDLTPFACFIEHNDILHVTAQL